MSCHHEWKVAPNEDIGYAECALCHDEMSWESIAIEASEGYAVEKAAMRDLLAKVVDDAEPDPWNRDDPQTYVAVIPKDLVNQIRKLLGWDEV
jgi:hypothetical protein